MNWAQLWDYLYGNRVAIETATILIVSAGIKTMPTPGSPFRAYDWFYDWSHQFLNITNTRLTNQPIPTPPDNKEVQPPSPKSK